MNRCLVRLMCCLAVTIFASTANAIPQFTDMSASAGVEFTLSLTESLAWGDYDNDGDQDLYLTNQGANVLMRNDGNFNFTDVTMEAGVGDVNWGVGTAFGDLDNDGDLDLYVVNFGAGATDVLYENLGPTGPMGAYVFSDISTAAGITLANERSSRGMTLLDYNNDGLLDIYVNAIGDDLLYVNQGGLEFLEQAATHGLTSAPGTGVGVCATDANNDGKIDIFTGNRSFDSNILYLNSDSGFVTDPTNHGISAIGLGMGVASFDFDNDLDFDLYWTTWPGENMNPNAFYENVAGNFVDIAAAAGVEDAGGWGISINTGDINNDGLEDFFVTNGFSDTTTANVLFQNNGDGTFSDITAMLGGGNFDGRGVAFADVDNDGDMDLCVTADAGEPTKLWRNDSTNGNHWLRVNLVAQAANRSAIGAKIRIDSGGFHCIKEVSGGAGRGSFNSIPVEFGLGATAGPVNLTVFWPSGMEETLGPIAVDQSITITELLLGDVNLDGAV